MASYKLERRLFVLFALSFVCTIGLLLHLTFQLSSEQANSDPAPAGIGDLIEEMESIEATLTKEREQMEELSRNFDQRFGAHPRAQIHRNLPAAAAKQQMIWSEPIPVLVLVCNRVEAVRESVKKLLRYRPSKEQFPIVVSQDCDNRALQSAVREEFGDEVQYIKHLSAETVRLKVPAEQRKFAVYYKISRHYRLALNHVFEKQNFSSVIITEDDLDIAADFFDYFLATRPLLETDPSLFCVSAWNDNGKPGLIDPNGTAELHRTDFFPGLGWMMTRNLWLEIGPKWPAGFWDDFVREPEQRRDRSCIRPEISRTSMTAYGRSGASKGLFFNRHLRRIVLNQVPVQFTKMSLEFLRKPAYDAAFLQRIQSLPKISVEELIQLRRGNGSSPAEFRVPYESMDQFVVIAKRIGIMADTKAGVPRTAYLGVVSCFFNDVRLHIAPADLAQWRGYDRLWQAPQAVLDGLD